MLVLLTVFEVGMLPQNGLKKAVGLTTECQLTGPTAAPGGTQLTGGIPRRGPPRG